MTQRELNSLCNKIAAGAKYALMASTESLKQLRTEAEGVYRRYAVANAKGFIRLGRVNIKKLLRR